MNLIKYTLYVLGLFFLVVGLGIAISDSSAYSLMRAIVQRNSNHPVLCAGIIRACHISKGVYVFNQENRKIGGLSSITKIYVGMIGSPVATKSHVFVRSARVPIGTSHAG